ncbi:MAG TPA: Na+/H+ antiporter [Hyphomonadaceae bacterium]|nr:Na+/H+ antiporter [Hyphomonadaceae bacterium]HPN06000.1 Na+/H+ antiporter [Hyphomonadaceae bacterium]
MGTIDVILVMLLGVVASGYVVRMLPIPLPLPLVQIAIGAVIAYATSYRVELEPDIFFLLFLPPLLFLDGWRIPKQDLLRDRSIVLELALGLVLFTVVGVGFFIHWLIPSMPMAVAFALAAVISPTDPIAVSAISARTPIPKRIMHILEGESLLNDASGLVCLRFAIAAALTGTFSIVDASLTFLQLALGGIAIGVGVTWVITWAKGKLSKKFGEESGTQILISLLIPFAAYLAAERFHCSGILAAVAAGITMSFVEVSGQAMASTRIRRSVVWDMLQFALSGVIFVLLGEQLPGIVTGAKETVEATGHHETWWLLIYAGAITGVLGLLRFIWVWVSVQINFRRDKTAPDAKRPGWRVVAVMSLAGVRGAITLAGVLTIPLVLADGTNFPARDLAILLAASVIIVSLLGATFFLPMLLKGLEMPAEAEHLAVEDKTRVAAAQAAIKAIEAAQHEMSAGKADADIYIDTAVRLMDVYRERIQGRSQTGEAAELVRRSDEIEKKLRIAALRAERAEIYRLARARQIEHEVATKLVREIDLMETRYA